MDIIKVHHFFMIFNINPPPGAKRFFLHLTGLFIALPLILHCRILLSSGWGVWIIKSTHPHVALHLFFFAESFCHHCGSATNKNHRTQNTQRWKLNTECWTIATCFVFLHIAFESGFQEIKKQLFFNQYETNK